MNKEAIVNKEDLQWAKGYPTGMVLVQIALHDNVIRVPANIQHPMDVIDGDLHIFDNRGYLTLVFASGQWVSAGVLEEDELEKRNNVTMA